MNNPDAKSAEQQTVSKSFVDVFKQLSLSDLKLKLYSSTAEDVERALLKPTGDLDSLLALLSPAAEPYLEQMAQQSVALTRQRFGASIGMYIPLYLSNLCANECDYCGFTMSNKIKRKTLSQSEILDEIKPIKSMGYDSILLVSGEHETKVGVPYFKQMLPLIRQHFSYVAMEVQPLEEQDYRELVAEGLDAVMLYQETYNPLTYKAHHTRGKKSDFAYRLESPDRVAKAGVDKIGLGVLLGLDDWRLDALLMGHHLAYLERTYWRSRFSISLPRLRPCTGGVAPKVELTDKGLVQMICAFRLFNQQLEISLSTRETPKLRDNLFALGVTNVSAGSSTQPGGYVEPNTELDQFEISDERSPDLVANAMLARGLNPVWKDWETGW
ncbi:2-iminoacetate synthase ThiH [Shewanella fidelis]|uniref:2-iminoacetate synthase ThiH n=1 Tax=Shewanella fidelis TaxID=173509 RepID=A0AAW8NLF5_9GAMM|nr:2-iminoacetate synthase ThiH [Shewanella fidelis]MDR8524038.1 2-iminoacetate synthase ThiH [Shewanella fidelis]MDW4810585.1 2-iminoacetate synthase ThiH [Shewanella fidelis]MDW4814706.1 2-iminoacetate synthase ThiH [Shewanella fidelis]MDW4818796.1 2-iminoacetate synthase ThiH [Shewanella fidelis]MDW4823527.1 2-iminoacetate synthase ThiH [Shewanella fidelis]